jgi:ribose transport system permease protein
MNVLAPTELRHNDELPTSVNRRVARYYILPATTGILLGVLIIVSVILQPSILSFFQMGLFVQIALPLVFVCMGQALVLLTGGLDLSVGGTLAVATVMTATWVGSFEGLRLVVILLLGMFLGTINGILVTRVKLNPFIVTLATWSIFDGIALNILPTDGGTPPMGFTNWITGTTVGVPNSFVVLAVAVVVWMVWSKTRSGRHLFATGSDEERAIASGVNVDRVRILAYALSGTAAAMAGICLALVTSTGSPTAGDGYILPSIEGAVIGGVSLLGGKGGAGLAILGAFILVFIANVTQALNLEPWVSDMASALLLLVVVGTRALLERDGAK